MIRDVGYRLGRALAAAAIALIAWTAPRADAQELVYGSWPPAGEFLNSTALPIAFKEIEADTKGAVKWKLIPQAGRGRAHAGRIS
jgi:hypothetical protein